jgi:polyisoprenoid-binding protein YceI
LALAAPAPARAAQALVLAQSDIRFVTTQMGVPVEGRFRQFSAQTAFDPRAPQTARIGMVIDMASATFGIRDTDAELGKPEWFHTPRFPQAKFDSSAVRAVAPGRFEVQGQLSIKGVSKALSVPVRLTQAASPQGLLTQAQGEFVIRRMDFKIGDGEWGDPSIVANEVTVKFRLALTGVPPL